MQELYNIAMKRSRHILPRLHWRFLSLRRRLLDAQKQPVGPRSAKCIWGGLSDRWVTPETQGSQGGL